MLKYILTLLFCSYAWLGSADAWLLPCDENGRLLNDKAWHMEACESSGEDCIYNVRKALLDEDGELLDTVRDCVDVEFPVSGSGSYRHIPLDTPYFVIIGLFITYVLIIYYRRRKV